MATPGRKVKEKFPQIATPFTPCPDATSKQGSSGLVRHTVDQGGGESPNRTKSSPRLYPRIDKPGLYQARDFRPWGGRIPLAYYGFGGTSGREAGTNRPLGLGFSCTPSCTKIWPGMAFCGTLGHNNGKVTGKLDIAISTEKSTFMRDLAGF